MLLFPPMFSFVFKLICQRMDSNTSTTNALNVAFIMNSAEKSQASEDSFNEGLAIPLFKLIQTSEKQKQSPEKNTNLTDSDIKDFDKICNILSQRSNKKLSTLQQGNDTDKLRNVAKLDGSLPEIPESKPSEKIRIRDLRDQALKQHSHSLTLPDKCSVCLNSLEESITNDHSYEIVMLDNCGHIMCKGCIAEWGRKYKLNCPTCRHEFENLWPLHRVSSTEFERSSHPLVLTPQQQWTRSDDEFYNDAVDSSSNICQACKRGINYNLMLICDECDYEVCHTYCDPAIQTDQIPDEVWYCLNCRMDAICYNVSKSEELRRNRRRQRLPQRVTYQPSQPKALRERQQRPNYNEKELYEDHNFDYFEYIPSRRQNENDFHPRRLKRIP